MTFTIRAWPVNATADPVEKTTLNLSLAIGMAYGMAHDRTYRSVEVVDDRAMRWAQFNMLWSADDHH